MSCNSLGSLLLVGNAHRSYDMQGMTNTRTPERFFESIAKQSAYKSELMQASDEIRRLARKIAEEALQCFQSRLADMDKAGEQGRHQLLSGINEVKAEILILQTIYRQLASHPAFRVEDKEQDLLQY